MRTKLSHIQLQHTSYRPDYYEYLKFKEFVCINMGGRVGKSVNRQEHLWS